MYVMYSIVVSLFMDAINVNVLQTPPKYNKVQKKNGSTNNGTRNAGTSHKVQ